MRGAPGLVAAFGALQRPEPTVTAYGTRATASDPGTARPVASAPARRLVQCRSRWSGRYPHGRAEIVRRVGPDRGRVSRMTDPELLRQFWGMHGAEIWPLGGGMNSETWLVKHQGSTYVAN